MHLGLSDKNSNEADIDKGLPMAEVTVSELAMTVGASVDRLLKQMTDAGLAHTNAEALVSDGEKQVLLAYLKGLHGAPTREPGKITLRRKTLTTLKSANRKTVNIEVRRKRTFVKRPDEVVSISPPGSAETSENKKASSNVASAKVLDEVEAQRVAAIETRRKADEEAKDNESQRDLTKTESLKSKTVDLTDKKISRVDPAVADLSTPPSEIVHDKGRRTNKAKDDDDPIRRVKKPIAKGVKKKSHLVLEDVEVGGNKKTRLRSAIATPLKVKNKHIFKLPTEKKIKEISVGDEISVSDLASGLSLKSGDVIRKLAKLGVVATAQELIDQETALLVTEELGHKATPSSNTDLEEQLVASFTEQERHGTQLPRAPVVTIMGHVDHGKTSLLDYIRKTKIAIGEAGGITQHIGAYHVSTTKGAITFLDTPGHAAFTAMRARGAKSTDIVILVVAADDGVMPQTEEAVQHARAAGVPIVVAINKMDKEGADPEKVTGELGAKDVIPEQWGGDTQFVEVSAQTGEGIDELLDAVLLQSELLELTASFEGRARGVIVESRIDKGRGVVATALVQEGNLNRGDFVLAGLSVGKIRAMVDQSNQALGVAGPSIPVEILGLDEAPDAGDLFYVVSDERKGRDIAASRQDKSRAQKMSIQHASALETMFVNIGSEVKRTLPLVIKTDVRGSLEAISGALNDFSTEEVGVDIVASGVGGIAESDVNLAITTGAIILGFNVRASAGAHTLAKNEEIEIRYYSVIYNLLDEVKAALSGMLSPESRESIVGTAEVRDVFRSPKFGAIAGCMVIEGTVYRSKPIRVLRDNVVIYEGELESLRRYKDDAQEVRNGVECGIGVKDYNDVRSGDLIEVYEVTQILRTL